jgi:hypothetical protein
MSSTGAAVLSRHASDELAVVALGEVLHGASTFAAPGDGRVSAGLVLSIGAGQGALDSAAAVSERVRTVIAAVEVFSSSDGGLGTLILGRSVPWNGQDLPLLGVILERNGELCDTGAGAAALEDPLLAVVHAAAAARPLDEGDLVYTGRLVAPSPVIAGDHVTATFAHIGAIHLAIT